MSDLLDQLSDQIEEAKTRIRAMVEHPFRVLKREFGDVKTRYRKLKKNEAKLLTLFAMSNLWMVRTKAKGAQKCVHLEPRQMATPKPGRGQSGQKMASNSPAGAPKVRNDLNSAVIGHELLQIVQTFLMIRHAEV